MLSEERVKELLKESEDRRDVLNDLPVELRSNHLKHYNGMIMAYRKVLEME